MPENHDKLVGYISDTYYKGGSKEEISQKILSDEGAYQKALQKIHQDKYKGVDFDSFKTSYESKYGNPYEVKKKSIPETPYNASEDVLLKQLEPSGSGYEDVVIERPDFNNTVASESTAIAKPVVPELKEKVNIQSAKDIQEGENDHKIISDFSFADDIGKKFDNILASNKALPAKLNLVLNNVMQKTYKNLENIGFDTGSLQANTLANQIGNLQSIDEEAVKTKPTQRITDAFSEGDSEKIASSVVGGLMDLSDSMIKSVATFGTSLFAQPIAESYHSTLQETAAQNGTSPLSVLMSDKDKELVPLITGVISGSLEKIGLDKIGASWLKKAPMGVWKKVAEVAKTSGVEGTTEALQEIVDQVGEQIANGKEIDVAWNDVLESGLVGLTSGGIASGVGTSVNSKKETQVIEPAPAANEVQETQVDRGTEPVVVEDVAEEPGSDRVGEQDNQEAGKPKIAKDGNELFQKLDATGALNKKGSEFGRYDVDLTPRDFDKAVRDIRNGKESKQATTLLEYLDKTNKDGFVSISQGSGTPNLRGKVGIPLDEYIAENERIGKEVEAVTEDKFSENVLHVIKNENQDVLLDNIENNESFFAGFPYELNQNELTELKNIAKEIKDGKAKIENGQLIYPERDGEGGEVESVSEKQTGAREEVKPIKASKSPKLAKFGTEKSSKKPKKLDKKVVQEPVTEEVTPAKEEVKPVEVEPTSPVEKKPRSQKEAVQETRTEPKSEQPKKVTFADPMGISSKPMTGDIQSEVKDASGKTVSYKIKSNGINYTVKAKDVDSGVALSTDKLYAMPIGAQSESKGRIAPDPIVGEKPKMLKDIVLDLSKGIKSKIYYTKSPSSRRSLGSYNPKNAAIAIKFNNDLDVTAHELGHSLDDQYGILTDASPEIRKELKPFSKFGSKPQKGHPNPEQYRMGEGVAEWIRAYIVNPEQAKKDAPKFYEWFENKVPATAKKSINDFSNDIRAYAGATAHDQIMSNVQWNPEKQKGGIIDALKPKSTQKDNFEITWGDNVNTKWLNSLRPFEKAVEFAKGEKGVTDVLPENDPRVVARLFLGINEKFDNIIKEGLVDSRNDRIKDGKDNMTLEWLIAPLDNSDTKSIESEAQEVISYMVAERTVELGKRFERKSILTGIGGGIYRDVDTANKRLTEFNDLKSSNPEKHARILEAARRYREYSDNILRYMTDKGRMSEEAYAEIKKNNLQYVALNRILEAAPDEEIATFKGEGGGSLASITNPVNKIKGSTKTIKNPYSSLLDFAYKGIKEADRNDVMLTFRDFFTEERGMYDGPTNKLGQIARKAAAADKNTVKIFVNGKEEYWQLQEDVYQAVKNINSAGYKFPALMTALPKLLRWTVTNFPVFALRNRIRDVQHRLVISKTNARKGYDIYTKKGVKSQTRTKFQLFGGGQSGYYLKDDQFYKDQMDFAIKNLSKSKNTIVANPKLLAKYAWDKYQGMIQGSETAGRLEEFRSAYKVAKKKGLDDYNASLYAAYESRDLMDFAVAGTYMREVNKLIPFSNAAVQGMRKTIRTAKEDPKGFAIRWALYSAIPSMLTRVLIESLDKEEEYQQLPAYQRDLFYNVPIASNLWVSIPKPFEIGVLGSGTERLLDYALYDNKKAFEGYSGVVGRTTLPISESDLAGPLQSFVEVMTNYDFFRQKNIISPYEVDKDLSLRNTDRASRLGQTVQKAIGVDGRYIDHIVQSNTSYFGNLALTTSDIGREDAKYTFDWSDLGVFKQSPVYNSRDVQWVMTYAKQFGMTTDKEFKEMNFLISDYFDANSNEDKERVGKVVREYAKDLRGYWEEVKPKK